MLFNSESRFSQSIESDLALADSVGSMISKYWARWRHWSICDSACIWSCWRFAKSDSVIVSVFSSSFSSFCSSIVVVVVLSEISSSFSSFSLVDKTLGITAIPQCTFSSSPDDVKISFIFLSSSLSSIPLNMSLMLFLLYSNSSRSISNFLSFKCWLITNVLRNPTWRSPSGTTKRTGSMFEETSAVRALRVCVLIEWCVNS